jgi:hypothetical protein
MRKDFVTNFWQNAYDKLPPGVRGQYLTQMKAAESWELTIGDLIKVGSRVKNAMGRAFQTPKTKRA